MCRLREGRSIDPISVRRTESHSHGALKVSERVRARRKITSEFGRSDDDDDCRMEEAGQEGDVVDEQRVSERRGGCGRHNTTKAIATGLSSALRVE